MTTFSNANSNRPSPGEITMLLAGLQGNRAQMADRLFPITYGDLREMAHRKFRHERPMHTLQPTELVHEAFVRLRKKGPDRYANRAHFFATASRAMDQCLIDYARKRATQKRGGGRQRVLLDQAEIVDRVNTVGYFDGVDALHSLEKVSPPLFQIAVLRLTYGFSVAEISALLDAPKSDVRKAWRLAKHWLRDAVGSDFHV